MKETAVQLNAETHDNIVDMINSVDKENRVVALTCIENVDFNPNLVYILLLKKQGDASSAEWKEYAPNTSGMLKGLGINIEEPLTWKQMLNVMGKQQVPEKDIQFYLDRYVKYLYNSIRNLGYDFIDKLEITLKLKSNGQQNRTTSESEQELDA